MDDLRCSFCGIKVAQGKSKCPVCGTKIATLGSLNLDKASSVINGIGEKARTTNIKEFRDRFKGRLSNQNNTLFIDIAVASIIIFIIVIC